VVVAMGVAAESLEVVTLEIDAVAALGFVVVALVVAVVTLGNIVVPVPVALEVAVVLQKLGVPWLVATENSAIVVVTTVVLAAAAAVVVVEEVIAPASCVHCFEEVMKAKLSLEFPLVKMQ
jgi:hypothetical protein